jgi:hypothetical protein
MLLATWNLNNRVGKVKFRLDAANAAASLGADLIVFTEYYPKEYHQQFTRILKDSGLRHQTISKETEEVANRILIVSRLPLEIDTVILPEFDRQFPSNVLPVYLPDIGLRILGLRIPFYKNGDPKILRCWDWVESTANGLISEPAIIVGDLNLEISSNKTRGGEHFRRLLENGWERSEPTGGYSYFNHKGGVSEIDHILASKYCKINGANYVTTKDKYEFVSTKSAISDHAALLADLSILAQIKPDNL